MTSASNRGVAPLRTVYGAKPRLYADVSSSRRAVQRADAAHGAPGLRADARRNREQVLRTAQHLFATEGLGVSLDEIARRAGVGPGTVHRHFPTKEALYLAVATDQLEQLVAEGEALAATDDPAALFTLLSRMMAVRRRERDREERARGRRVRPAHRRPDVAADITRTVANLLDRAHAAGVVRPDLTVDEVMALVAGAFAAIRHADAETSRERSAHLAEIILDGIRPR